MSEATRMPGVPEARRQPVLNRYPLRRHRLPIGSRTLSVVLPDDRAWLRKGTWAAGVVRGKEPPYWIRVWPAAMALARHLARAPRLAGMRVLDLGCGVGIPGIQATCQGARTHFVDRESDALAFASWNAEQQPTGREAPTVEQVDWALGAVTGTFDVILLSDVTYHESHHAPVRRQLAAALAPGGVVLHSDPLRELSTEFLRSLDQDFATSKRHVTIHHDGKQVEVRVSLLTANEQDQSEWQQRLRWPSVQQNATGSPNETGLQSEAGA